MQIAFGVVYLQRTIFHKSVNAIKENLTHEKQNCLQIISIVRILLKVSRSECAVVRRDSAARGCDTGLLTVR